MCGIAGIAFFTPGRRPVENTIRVMCNTIRHRGPDSEGIYMRDGVGMGMRRLSIIDISGGNQPIFNEDKTIAVMMNGEIYNYRELRNQLRSLGHIFATQSDTEVIVHAYEAFGTTFPSHLNGMFAIALHDSAKKVLLLARDHVGIKPLYYSLTRESIVWGSEVKTVLASSLVNRNLSMNALAEYLTWEYVPGTNTLLKDVARLAPASTVAIDLSCGITRFASYWDIPAQDQHSGRSQDDWLDAVDSTVRRCVRRQMVSDVPLGAFLSGGVDSSLVAAGMGHARTFSIGFEDPAYNELPWAKRVAQHLHMENTSEVITPDVMDLYSSLTYHMDDPIGDFSIFPTYLVSRLTRRHVTVSLSGDGGDELFGGYETHLAGYLDAMIKQWIPECVLRPVLSSLLNMPSSTKKGSLSSRITRYAAGFTHPAYLDHARWRNFGGAQLLSSLMLPEARSLIISDPDAHIPTLFEKAGHRDWLNRCLYVDLKSYLCDCLLTKLDRTSMAVSLEARVPLLDTELIELAFQIPGKLKLHNFTTKHMLKMVASRYLPRAAVFRPKRGFTAPVRDWLHGSLRPLMEDLLDTQSIRQQGIFDSRFTDRLMREHLERINNNSHLLWSLMMFQSWQRRWLRA